MAGMNSLAKRLKYARDRLSLSQEKLAELSGLKQSDISKIETSRILRTTGIVSLAKALRCSPDWLESGEGRPQWDGAANVDQGPTVRGEVPLISWVQAGSWNGAEDPLEPGDAERWLPCPARHGNRTYALRVRGDSMTAPYGRTYPEGSIVFVDPERKAPTNGERIIAKLAGSDEVTFKVYKEEDGRRWLQPLNPSHQPIRDEFRVLGTVIGKWEDE